MIPYSLKEKQLQTYKDTLAFFDEKEWGQQWYWFNSNDERIMVKPSKKNVAKCCLVGGIRLNSRKEYAEDFAEALKDFVPKKDMHLFKPSVGYHNGPSIAIWNDVNGRTLMQVRNLLKRAIKHLEAEIRFDESLEASKS